MKVILSALILFSIPAGPIWAEKKIPDIWGPVMDEAGLLNRSQSDQISAQIRSYVPKVQMQVWIADSLDHEPIESVSIRAVEKWKLGDAKLDNGLLLLIALKDRAVRIEVGQGLEGDIPDAYAGRVIDYILVPAFKNRDYANGISDALANLQQKIENPALEAPQAKKNKSDNSIFLILFLLIFFGPFVLSLLGLNRGIRSGGGGFGGGSWGGGGFGGGGWSGGGGGFSGGGSSGRW